MKPLVGIIMGSESDLTVMQAAADMLNYFSIPMNSPLFLRTAHPTG